MFKWTQRAFTGGVQDEALRGRQDLAVYYTAAKSLDNFIVKRQGCIEKRRGTDLVANLEGLFGDGFRITHTRAIPFVYERDGGYVLLFAEGAKTLDYIEESGETTEDSEVQRCIVVCSAKGILHTDGNGATSWHRSVKKTDTVYPSTIDIPYRGEEFDDIGYTQSGDTLFIAHHNHPFATLVCSALNTFVFKIVDFKKLGADTMPVAPIIQSVTGSGFETSGSKKSVEYCATAVVDGIESAPSTPFKFTYNLPWASKASANIVVVDQKPEPDFYNIYKRSGASWGLIGSTSDRAIPVQTLPKTTTSADHCFAPNWIQSSYEPPYDSHFPLTSASANSNYGYGRVGYVYNNGTINISYENPVYIDEIIFNIGHVFATWNSGAKPVAKVQFLPCKAVIFKCVVTFEDKQTTTKTSSSSVQEYTYINVPSENYKDGPWGSEWAQAISDAALSFGENTEVSAVIYDKTVEQSSKKKVKSIAITGYADAAMTTVATGSVSGAYDIAINGNPIILNGIRMVVRGASSTNFYDDYITPDVSLTPPNNEPHFDAAGKYPSCVALKEQRLVLAATENSPFTLWMSTAGDLYNFNVHDSIREDDAIEATVPATEFPEINHVVAAKEMLLLCDNGEWVVSPVTGNTISYKTIQIKQQSQIGCSKRLPPLQVADEILFAESTNETLRSIRYEFTSDGYQSTDLSVMSQTLTRNNPIVDYAYKQHPDSTVVCVLKDGTLAILTYMKEHEVCAWSHAVLGGEMKAIGICTDKAITDGTTHLYLLAERKGQHCLLRVRESSLTDTVRNAVCLDAIEEVVATENTVLDGRVAIHPETGQVVETLQPGETYLMGYPFDAVFRSVRPEAQGQDTIQFELKNPANMEIRVRTPSDFNVVPTDLEDVGNMATVVETKTRAKDGMIQWDSQRNYLIPVAGDYNISGAITLRTRSHLPFELLSYSINFSIDPKLSNQRG